MGSSSEIVIRTWPTLYKKTSTGADQEWTVSVVGNKIFTRYGQVGGKIQETPPTVCEGKNVGRSNGTTPEEQALSEAQSLWEKKLKKDYVTTLDAARKGESSDLIEGGILPMLAKRYDQDAEKIVWPAYAQPKLDGHRCIAVVDSKGKCTLWSRTRKPINSMPHIVKAIEELGEPNHVFDGELYNHAYHAKFEELSHFIRQSQPEKGCEIVQYHIYDIARDGSYASRYGWLATHKFEVPLVEVETVEVANENELMAAFEKFCKDGYEGAIIRNSAGLYVNKRSYDLQKVKEFDDSEFKVIGVVEGKGKLAGHGIFVCETDKGAQFEAKMIGALEELRKFYQDPSLAVGKMLTVKYQGFTTKSRVPRFPVALRFREDI